MLLGPAGSPAAAFPAETVSFQSVVLRLFLARSHENVVSGSAVSNEGISAEITPYGQWWDSPGSQEPVLGISLIPRTGCWHGLPLQTAIMRESVLKKFESHHWVWIITCPCCGVLLKQKFLVVTAYRSPRFRQILKSLWPSKMKLKLWENATSPQMISFTLSNEQ